MERSKDWIDEAERLIEYAERILKFCSGLLSSL
jgi:HEPN domain-containing protein